VYGGEDPGDGRVAAVEKGERVREPCSEHRHLLENAGER
jgi:hypothetical protein